MTKSILSNVVNNMVSEDKKISFVNKISEQHNLPQKSLLRVYENAYETAKQKGLNNPEKAAKANVFSYVEEHKPLSEKDNGDVDEYQIYDTKEKQWVGKPNKNKKRLINKADKLDNEYGAVRYQVRKVSKTNESQFGIPQNDRNRTQRRKDRLKNAAQRFASQALERGQTSKDLYKRARLSDKLGEPNTDALFKAGDMLAKREQSEDTQKHGVQNENSLKDNNIKHERELDRLYNTLNRIYQATEQEIITQFEEKYDKHFSNIRRFIINIINKVENNIEEIENELEPHEIRKLSNYIDDDLFLDFYFSLLNDDETPKDISSQKVTDEIVRFFQKSILPLSKYENIKQVIGENIKLESLQINEMDTESINPEDVNYMIDTLKMKQDRDGSGRGVSMMLELLNKLKTQGSLNLMIVHPDQGIDHNEDDYSEENY